MRDTFALSLLLMLATCVAMSQDTVKVMTWNLLNYQSSNSTRDQYYRTVIRHVKPDVLVVQEVTSQAAVDSFFSRVVNLVFPGQFAKGTFIDGPDTDNELYYKPAKFSFVSNTPIRTALRNISEFKLYALAAADTLRVYSAHLKAGSTSADSIKRGAEVDSLRRTTNALPYGRYFLVLGDFNIYRSTEIAYQKLIQINGASDGHFVDPWNMPGLWNAAQYAQYHSQSTRTRQLPDSGATGGLDDRFDMILFSRAASQTNAAIRYLPGSLTPVGNDGNHYNDSINRQPNTAVPDSVANALYFASDHLPVTARLVLTQSTVVGNYPVTESWNLVSVPLTVTDYRTTSLFPTAISSAFGFNEGSGYVVRDTLKNGVGYWVRFPSPQNVSMTGIERLRDTVLVSAGWNLIGSLANPAAVTAIIQIPPGIVSSAYYGYSGLYSPVDSLRPAKAYWVKINQNGALILR